MKRRFETEDTRVDPRLGGELVTTAKKGDTCFFLATQSAHLNNIIMTGELLCRHKATAEHRGVGKTNDDL